MLGSKVRVDTPIKNQNITNGGNIWQLSIENTGLSKVTLGIKGSDTPILEIPVQPDPALPPYSRAFTTGSPEHPFLDDFTISFEGGSGKANVIIFTAHEIEKQTVKELIPTS